MSGFSFDFTKLISTIDSNVHADANLITSGAVIFGNVGLAEADAQAIGEDSYTSTHTFTFGSDGASASHSDSASAANDWDCIICPLG